MAGDWSDEQNDAIVADYFTMLANDTAGRPYSKADRSPPAAVGDWAAAWLDRIQASKHQRRAQGAR